MSEENKDLEIIADAQELDDADLEEVSGGGCSNGGGCVDGDCSDPKEQEIIAV